MKSKKTKPQKELKITKIIPTDLQLTGIAGLSVFARYLRKIAFLSIVERLFGSLRKSRKGLPINELFVQILCFFMDGTSRHLTWFDQIKADNSRAYLIETKELASSHAIKRFIGSFEFCRVFLFRNLFQKIFIWRLKQSLSSIIVLGLDTMVLNNDYAKKRHGVQSTYKNVNGFQPLQLTWRRYFADAVFRGGSKHSNHGDTVLKMVEYIVKLIRKEYRKDVPIIIRMDAGFYDDKIFSLCEKLGIGFMTGGKEYNNVLHLAAEATEWQPFEKSENDRKLWMLTEFMCKQKSWKKERRTIVSSLVEEDGQYLFEGMCRDSVMITNIGMSQDIDERLKESGHGEWLKAETILAQYHDRGADELANRALKTFGHEQLPFKQFSSNAVWYNMMLLGHNLFEAFKEDVTDQVIAASVYADTFRRKFIDTAGQIIRHAGRMIMKVPRCDFNRLQFHSLLAKCQNGLPQLC